MAQSIKLRDENGSLLLPYTLSDLVYIDDNTKLSEYILAIADTLLSINSKIIKLENTSSTSEQVNLIYDDNKVIVKYSVSSTLDQVNLIYDDNLFSSMEIDGVELDEIVRQYTFDSSGEHIVKYTLKNPTSIGDWAFNGCDRLISVTIPNSVTSIGDGAFYMCSRLTSIIIPDSVISIGNQVFIGSNLKDVTIGNSVTSIGDCAFLDCHVLEYVTIGNSVTSIGDNAFWNCTGLTGIICNAITAPTISSTTFRNVKANGTLMVPAGSIGYDVWVGNGNYLGKYNWTKVGPVKGNQILCKYNVSDTSSPVKLYKALNCSLMRVDGNEQEVTNEYTFDTTGEHTVLFRLLEGVTSIGDDAFVNCPGLTSVTIGNSVTSIGNQAFNSCSGLTFVNIGNSVKSIGDDAFGSCSRLISVIIPDSVTSIGNGAFGNCSRLTSITIPNSVTSIGNYAFRGCSILTSVIISDSVTSIGESVFSMCYGLTSIHIPDSVTSIKQSAFADCEGLTSITIPDSVTSISGSAFYNCIVLTNITCNATTAPTIEPSTFQDIKTNGILTVPAGSTGYDVWMGTGDNYLGKYNWTIVEPLEGAKILCKYNVFNTSSPVKLYEELSCSSMEVDGVKQEVTKSYTFDTTGEHTVLFTLPKGVTSIINYAFSDCYELTSVSIGNSVTSIGNYAFSGCSVLTFVTIGNSVTSIGESAFVGCSGLTSVTIGNSVTSIGESAFGDCVELTSITIPNSVASIGAYAFGHCRELTSITIPNSVTSIGNLAFSVCSGLTSVTIGNSVTLIGERVFDGCSELTSITCNAITAPTILSTTFQGINSNGTLTVPLDWTGYDVWMGRDDYYLGSYHWDLIIEQ